MGSLRQQQLKALHLQFYILVESRVHVVNKYFAKCRMVAINFIETRMTGRTLKLLEQLNGLESHTPLCDICAQSGSYVGHLQRISTIGGELN